jgi:hypothetical protein
MASWLREASYWWRSNEVLEVDMSEPSDEEGEEEEEDAASSSSEVEAVAVVKVGFVETDSSEGGWGTSSGVRALDAYSRLHRR